MDIKASHHFLPGNSNNSIIILFSHHPVYNVQQRIIPKKQAKTNEWWYGWVRLWNVGKKLSSVGYHQVVIFCNFFVWVSAMMVRRLRKILHENWWNKSRTGTNCTLSEALHIFPLYIIASRLIKYDIQLLYNLRYFS